MLERQLAKSSRCWNKKCKNVELDRLQPCTISSPPVHEREILVRASKDFIFKIYQKAYDASTRDRRRHRETVCRGPYLVWSPYGPPGCQPTSGSFLRLWFAILHAQPALHPHQREGDVPVMLSKRPKSFPAARAGSSVRGASECHLCGITVSVGRQ